MIDADNNRSASAISCVGYITQPDIIDEGDYTSVVTCAVSSGHSSDTAVCDSDIAEPTRKGY